MKKNIIIIAAILVLFAISSSFGQGKTLYAKFYGAYGLFTPGSYKLTSYSSNNSQDGTTSFKVPKNGMGGGLRVGAGLGLVLNDFLNLGLDGEYHIGNKITSESNYSYTNSTYTTNSSVEYTIFSIIPNITFKAISQPKYYIYTRLGPVIGIPLSMDGEVTTNYNSNGTVGGSYVKTNYELKVSLGYLAAIGVQVRISDAIRGFGEISAYGLSFNRDRDVQTESYTEDNSDQLPENKYIYLYKSEGEYTNSSELQPDGTTTYTYTQPQSPVNANAITVSIGVAIKL